MDRVSGLGMSFPDGIAKTYTSSNFVLTKTNPRHMAADDEMPATEKSASFRDLLLSTVDKASETINRPEQLTTQSIIDPESVNIADIPIAAKQAEIAIKTMTSVVTRALEAYRAIIALR